MHRCQVSQHKPDAAPCLSQCLWVCMPVSQGQAELWALRASSLRDLSVAHHLGRKLPQTEGYSFSLGKSKSLLKYVTACKLPVRSGSHFMGARERPGWWGEGSGAAC